MSRIKLTIQAYGGREKFIPVPQDWDELDEQDRKEFIEDEAQGFVLDSVKYSGTVIE